MKISYNWLKEHLPLELDAQDLAKLAPPPEEPSTD